MSCYAEVRSGRDVRLCSLCFLDRFIGYFKRPGEGCAEAFAALRILEQWVKPELSAVDYR
jgi:hypothetical protein